MCDWSPAVESLSVLGRSAWLATLIPTSQSAWRVTVRPAVTPEMPANESVTGNTRGSSGWAGGLAPSSDLKGQGSPFSVSDSGVGLTRVKPRVCHGPSRLCAHSRADDEDKASVLEPP